MKTALTLIVLIFLVFFGAYSVAPIFGLNELMPDVFGSRSRLGGGILVVLMLLGGLYWRGFWIISKKRRKGSADD